VGGEVIGDVVPRVRGAHQVSEIIVSWPPETSTPVWLKPKIAELESSVAPIVVMTLMQPAATCEPSTVSPLMPTFWLQEPCGVLHVGPPTSTTKRSRGKVGLARSDPSTMRRLPTHCGMASGADSR